MKRNGFLLGENLLAFGILIIGVTFLITTTRSIVTQKSMMEERLVAARLCKETLSTGKCIHQAGYQIKRRRGDLRVVKHGRVILEICKC